MRQAIMTEPGKIEFRDIPEPKIGKDEILLRIKRIGVCGSDVHVNYGKHLFTSYPVVQGHEFAAVVEAVGENISHVKPGMKATARPQLACGKYRPCLRGDYHICDELRVEGFQTPGCAQDLFITTKERIVPLLDSMTFDQGALVEPTAVAVHSTARVGYIKGKNVVVLGAGPIGNLVAQVTRYRGAKDILITDLSNFRLEIAKNYRISHTSNANQESLSDASKRVFKDEGFDIAFEVVGVEATMNAAIEVIEKGGTIVVLGVFEENPRINMSVAGDHELKIIGTLMYKHEDYEKAVELIASGEVITEPLSV